MVAMTSHQLAHALLARRDNDIRFLITVDDDPDGDRPYATKVVGPHDPEHDGVITGAETVTYYPRGDYILIRTGVVVIGGEEE